VGSKHPSSRYQQGDSIRRFSEWVQCTVSQSCTKTDIPVAKIRADKNLPPLKEFVIDVIAPDGTSLPADDAVALKTVKISSTAIREYIFNHQQPK
jgi:phosphopantetheine adenylyltransferase